MGLPLQGSLVRSTARIGRDALKRSRGGAPVGSGLLLTNDSGGVYVAAGSLRRWLVSYTTVFTLTPGQVRGRSVSVALTAGNPRVGVYRPPPCGADLHRHRLEAR